MGEQAMASLRWRDAALSALKLPTRVWRRVNEGTLARVDLFVFAREQMTNE